LDAFEASEIENSPELKRDLQNFITITTKDTCSTHSNSGTTQRSLLFLRIQAAAEFYTTNKTLMSNPQPVLVDISRLFVPYTQIRLTEIVLDPFIVNLLPASLATTAAYITLLALLSIPLSRKLYTFLTTVSI
jgi:hypothetical protein